MSVLPFIRVAYRNPSAAVELETASAVIAVVTAYLVAGRSTSAV